MRKVDVDRGRIELLECGTAASVTHIEQMVLDFPRLLDHTFPNHGFDDDAIRATPFIRRLRLVGHLLLAKYGSAVYEAKQCWTSDTVRGWIAMAIGADEDLSLAERIQLLTPFVRDPHFAVREWAWLALRPHIVAQPTVALSELEPHFSSEVAADRRFAVEVTRPRSVWGEHIPLFKNEPHLAERLLQPLLCEPDRYARASVANWLNDASRTHPAWTTALCNQWSNTCACDHTTWIVRRALRSISRPAGSLGADRR